MDAMTVEPVPPARRTLGLPATLLAYALALAVFLLLPPFLGATVVGVAGFTLQELVDLFTPLVVLPLAAVALWLAGARGVRWGLALLTVAIVWVAGQAIHLATNAIDNVIETGCSEAALASSYYVLAQWFDEVLSHWLWHLGWVGLSMLFLVAAARGRPRAAATGVALVLILTAGALHGFVFGITSIEGVTAHLGIPASVALLAGAMVVWRRGSPVAPFLAASSIVTLSGYAIWAALNAWTLPEFFSHVTCG